MGHVDRNFDIVTDPKNGDLVFKSVLQEPFRVYGVFYEDGKFRRLPEAVARSVSDKVLALHANTSGGRVRFITDSESVAIAVKYTSVYRTSHFTLIGSAGLDLYIKEEGGEESFYGSFLPPYDFTDHYESRHNFTSRRLREITVNMPLYSDVCELYVGLMPDARLLPPLPYADARPIVYYGNSITQGACASRPGNAFAAIASRAMGCDFINLGFSGAGRAEPEIAEYVAGLDMQMLVYDYDHNAPSAEYLAATHERMFKVFRESHPDTPVIMLSRTSMERVMGEREARKRVIYDTYRHAIDAGDKNVYFIDGTKVFGEFESMATVEGCHSNDLGQALIAKALISVMNEIKEKK